jgi:hypothetical protein
MQEMNFPGRHARKRDEGRLVEESFTSRRPAETGDSVRAADLALEFVIVGQFLICKVH